MLPFKSLIFAVLLATASISFSPDKIAGYLKGSKATVFSFNSIELTSAFKQSDSLEILWSRFINSRACIGGFQYVQKNALREQPKRLAFSSMNWSKLASKEPKKLTMFLLSKLQDTAKTTMHVCPFFGATTGEMAVYALQQIHNVNWYDFKAFKHYKQRDYASANDQPQMWLRAVLGKDKERKMLRRYFITALNN